MSRCSYQRTIVGRNDEGEIKGEVEWCDLNDCVCILMTLDTCEEYELEKEELLKGVGG